jgi:serine/threonine-protein kinase
MSQPPNAPANPPGDDDESTRIVAGDPSWARPGSAPNPATSPSTGGRGGTLPGNRRPAEVAGGGLNVREVGRYQILDKLGRGGMATVYRAHDPGINRDVAIKFLHANLSEDEEYRGRFLREARAAGGLSHPNIVVVYDVGEIEGRPYMAMELLEGDSLTDVLDKEKTLPVRDVVVMGMQLARALDYSHARGIVHRDIKPGNIVRLKDSKTIKVMDFGIAHVDDNATREQRTQVGDILGTPQYMSPEQARGDRLDGRSDLFSVGIVLYQMLTGQRPFKADSLVALAVKIAREEPQAIDTLRPQVPASLRRVVERCLAKAPENRFQNGRELSDALGKVLTELDAAEEEKNKPRIVPLRLKWAGMMALIVAAVMAVSATVITQRLVGVLNNQMADTGASLARFLAAQNAVSALSEDWVTVDVMVQEIMKTGDFASITVIDRGAVVRSSSDPALVGKPYQPPGGEATGQRPSGVATSRYKAGEEWLLGFETPITFQDKTVGRVALGLAERPLTQVARLSTTLMVVLALVTVAAVAIAMYFVANWFAKPIKLVGESMGEIAKGRFDHRIREQRKDEFGELYAAFDRMAQALQDRASGASPPTPTPTLGAQRTQAMGGATRAGAAAAANAPGAPKA